MKGLNV